MLYMAYVCYFLLFFGFKFSLNIVEPVQNTAKSVFEDFANKNSQSSLDAIKPAKERDLKAPLNEDLVKIFLYYADDCLDCLLMANRLLSLRSYLDGLHIKAKLFKINRKEAWPVIEDYDFKNVPDLLVKYNTSHCILRDNLQIQDLKDWTKRILYSEYAELTNVKDFEVFVKQSKSMVAVVYIPERTYQLEHIMKQLNCYFFYLEYYFIRNPYLAEVLNLKPVRSINIYRNGNFIRTWHLESTTQIKFVPVRNFLLFSKEPVLDYHTVYENELNFDKMLTYIYTEDERSEEIFKILTDFAEEYFEKIRFYHAKLTKSNQKELCKAFRFTRHYPLVMSIMKRQLKYVFPKNENLTKESIRNFISNVLSGQLKKYTGSENILRYRNPNSSMLKFSSSLLSNALNVNFTVLFIHTDDCTLCNNVLPQFSDFAEEHKNEPEYLFGTYNYDQNYDENLFFTNETFPKIIARFKSGRYIEYKGVMQFNELNDWINKGVPGELSKNLRL